MHKPLFNNLHCTVQLFSTQASEVEVRKTLISTILEKDSPLPEPEVIEKESGGQVDPQAEQNRIENFNINPKTIEHLKQLGFKHLFPIQAKCYDLVLEGKDVIARDRTGSGKTLSYCLPLTESFRLSKADRSKNSKGPYYLVVLPTRELVMQGCSVLNKLQVEPNEFRVLPVYGGTDVQRQISALERGCEFVLGTPGRLIDLLQRGALKLDEVETIVLDEADLMLDMGFSEDIEKIYSYLGEKASESIQTLLYSATMPSWVHSVAKKYLSSDKVVVDLVKGQEIKTPKTVKHLAIYCKPKDRYSILADIVSVYGGEHNKTIIFTETKQEANEIMLKSHLRQECQALHGDIPQERREQTFQAFREGIFPCLIATNVAARGLDIPEVDLIVQLDPPKDIESYIHRAGRTARAGKSGVCITLYNDMQRSYLTQIQLDAKVKFEHINPPVAEEVIKASAKDFVKSIEEVKPTTFKMFADVSQEIINKFGAEEAMMRALALISGNNIAHRSILTGTQNFITFSLEGVELKDTRDVLQFLKEIFSEEVVLQIGKIKIFNNRQGCAFEVKTDVAGLIEDYILNQLANASFKLSKPKDISELPYVDRDDDRTEFRRPGRESGRFERSGRESGSFSRSSGRESGSFGRYGGRESSRFGRSSEGDHRKSRFSDNGDRGFLQEETQSMYIKGLPRDCAKNEVFDVFESKGFGVQDVIILRDKETKEVHGAIVNFEKSSDCQRAMMLNPFIRAHRLKLSKAKGRKEESN